MTKMGKLSVISGAALAGFMLLKIEWSITNIVILSTGMLVGVVLAGAVVWWRLK